MGVRGGEGRGEASSNPAAKTTVAGNTASRPHAVARARQLELAWQSSWRQETCPPLPPARIVVISRSLSLTCTELTAMSSSTCQATPPPHRTISTTHHPHTAPPRFLASALTRMPRVRACVRACVRASTSTLAQRRPLQPSQA